MKKYLIVIMAVFIITMAGIVIATNIFETKNDIGESVFSFETLKATFKVDKKKIAEQRKTGEDTGNPAGVFLVDVDTSYVNDESGESGKSVSEYSDTEFFHASVLTEKDIKTREEYGLTKEKITELCAENAGFYCYETMEESLHQLYAEILYATTERLSEVPLCTREQKELDYAYRCVMNDHPEIYTVSGYTCVLHSANNTPVKIVYTAKYTMTEHEEVAAKRQIDAYTKQFLSGIRKDASDYDKVKYTYEYLIDHTEYVLDSKENQNICSVMLYNQSVCLGYAKSMQYLLRQLNVKSTVVEGLATGGEPHAWNMVHIHNAYYFVDVTWGDSSYGAADSVFTQGMNYDYLNITSDELAKSHIIDNVVPIPRCVEIADNYYVREGLYFDRINPSVLSAVFKEAFKKGEQHVTIKCSSDAVFQEMKDYLLEEQKIFDYMSEGTESISYGENPDMFTLTFLIK